jgi:aldehyde dehydrogenase (NAD+)
MNHVREIFESMDYGPALEAADAAEGFLDAHRRIFYPFVNGRFSRFIDECYFDSVDPRNGRTLARVVECGEIEVNAAVEAAKSAFPYWSALTGYERARYLYAIAREIQKHSHLLALLESMNSGKPIHASQDVEIPLVARYFYHHAGWAQLRNETFIGYEPIGVCALIIPWSFPLLMLAWKLAPALAAGNTVVIKPAPPASLAILLLAELLEQIQLPPGVVNIVTGDALTGELVVKHRSIQKISFTGSTEVGRQIRVETAGTEKHLSLSLSGKSPLIIFDDADLDSAIEAIVDSIWSAQGQICCAGSRLLVQEGVYGKLLAGLRQRMEMLRVGDPLDKGMDLGAIVTPEQLQKIQRLVERGKADGATFWQPGRVIPKEGLYYPPILFSEVEPASDLARIEIFGPVVVAMSFLHTAEAVDLANNTPFGLTASVWTENISLALEVAPKLKAGTVWINATNLFDAASGFGGYRESGFGREGGNEGMYEYLIPGWERSLPFYEKNEFDVHPRPVAHSPRHARAEELINRPPKLFIGGKQVRPEGGYSFAVRDAEGRVVSEAGLGNRKDIRNAVESARRAANWARTTAHERAQLLYDIAGNLLARSVEFSNRLQTVTGASGPESIREVDKTVERLFYYAAWADKYDGHIHPTPCRGLALAIPEPWGVLALVCPPDHPLLALVTMFAPAVAVGNCVVIVPSARFSSLATDFYQVLDTSNVPPGVVNVVTGHSDDDDLARFLAQHEDVQAIWYIGSVKGSAAVERESSGNLKTTWVNRGKRRNFFDDHQAQGWEYLRHAVQVKNIWLPYG